MSASPNSLIGAHPAGIDQPRRLFYEGTSFFATFFISNPEGTQLFLKHLHPILDDEGPMLETLVDYPLEPLSSKKPLQMSWVGGGLYFSIQKYLQNHSCRVRNLGKELEKISLGEIRYNDFPSWGT